MKRLLPALAVAALALPAAATAKELQSLELCGQGGECHSVRDHRSLAAYDRGLFDAAPPARGGPFLRLRLTIGGAEMPHPVKDTVAWLPGPGLLRSQGDDGSVFWLGTVDSAAAVLRRTARGLTLYPASKLGPLGGKPQAARVDEVVAAPPSGGGNGGGSSDGGGAGWAWSLLAIAPAGVAFWMLRRRRRAGPSPA